MMFELGAGGLHVVIPAKITSEEKMMLIDGGPEGTIITSHVPKEKVLPKPPADLGLLTYSGRAECLRDVLEFFGEIAKAQALILEMQINDDYLSGHDNKPHLIPDKSFQFSSNLTLDQLRATADLIVDCHVIEQTLRQCTIEENSMERRSWIK